MPVAARRQTRLLRRSRLATAAAAAFLGACGGGGSGQAPGSTASVELLQGYFRGGNVAGLNYESGQQAGVTSTDGRYSCEKDGLVSFSIGAVDLGRTTCATFVHAVSLAPSGQPADTSAVNIMRLLLVLDEDENPDNGISISESLRSVADAWTPIDFAAPDFQSELTLVIADIATTENRIIDTLPSDDAVLAFIDESLSCAYSGVYANLFGSGPSNTATGAALNIFRDADANTDIGRFRLIRQERFRPLFTDGFAVVDLGARPTMSGNDFNAQFVGTDELEGEWTSGIAAQDVDTRGSFELTRLGDIDGSYRFTGMAEASGQTIFGVSLQMRVALKLDGDTLSGEAFDNILGFYFDVTGSRLPDSNDYEIEIDVFGSATGTIILDANGEPIGLEGDWPGFGDGVFNAVGCRLI